MAKAKKRRRPKVQSSVLLSSITSGAGPVHGPICDARGNPVIPSPPSGGSEMGA